MSTQTFTKPHHLNSKGTSDPQIETRSGFDGLRGDSEGSCDACGLPLRIRGSFRVPGAPGKFCSVLCIECGLISGHSLCRWCGDELDSNRGFFCSERCRKQSEGVTFGNGTRLLNLLGRKQPDLFRKIAGPKGCLNCEGSLADRRAGSLYCGDACRKAYSRTAGKE